MRNDSGADIMFWLTVPSSGPHIQLRETRMSLQPHDRILRIKTVLQVTGLTRSTLYRKVQRGEFPKQIKLSERCAGWREWEVAAWMCDPMFYSVDDESVEQTDLRLRQ
jgi:prophage regulatory protein